MSPRKKSSDTSRTPQKTKVENSWLMLGTESLFTNSNFTITTLPNPSTGNPCKYCLDDKHKKIYEVVTFDEPHRSWFIGETVKSDGKIMILTPVDPVFLVLSRLRKECCNKAIPLEDLLSERGFEDILDFVPDLSSVADLKGPPDMKAYKYNEEKTLGWLSAKVHKLAKVLRAKNIHVKSGAVSATFVASSVESDSVDEEFYLKYAHGIISEYIQEDLAETLGEKMNFKTELIETLGKKRKSEVNDDGSANKKIKNKEQKELTDGMIMVTSQNASAGPTSTKKDKPIGAKEKARQKAASGTKAISSFFTKKT